MVEFCPVPCIAYAIENCLSVHVHLKPCLDLPAYMYTIPATCIKKRKKCSQGCQNWVTEIAHVLTIEIDNDFNIVLSSIVGVSSFKVPV